MKDGIFDTERDTEMSDTRLRERDPELFRLVNTLKAKRTVYRRSNPELYDSLVTRRTEVDGVLEADDCFIKIDSERDYLMISFFPDDEDYQNRLRRKLTVNEMRFYIVLLQLYSERYISSGDFVSVSAGEIYKMWEQLGFNSKRTQLNRRSLEQFVRTMRTYGILVDTGGDQYLIQPGILFAVDRGAFFEYYNGVLAPWFSRNEEDDAGKEKWAVADGSGE